MMDQKTANAFMAIYERLLRHERCDGMWCEVCQQSGERDPDGAYIKSVEHVKDCPIHCAELLFPHCQSFTKGK
jgi:hypothetical protein